RLRFFFILLLSFLFFLSLHELARRSRPLRQNRRRPALKGRAPEFLQTWTLLRLLLSRLGLLFPLVRLGKRCRIVLDWSRLRMSLAETQRERQAQGQCEMFHGNIPPTVRRERSGSADGILARALLAAKPRPCLMSTAVRRRTRAGSARILFSILWRFTLATLT